MILGSIYLVTLAGKERLAPTAVYFLYNEGASTSRKPMGLLAYYIHTFKGTFFIKNAGIELYSEFNT
jgi:hypothetical protein